jgi:hypothetical protein
MTRITVSSVPDTEKLYRYSSSAQRNLFLSDIAENAACFSFLMIDAQLHEGAVSFDGRYSPITLMSTRLGR